MRYYLKGGPISIKNSRYVREAVARRRDSAHLALIHRADQMHSASPSGLAIAAGRLKERGSIIQLREAAGQHLLMLVWVTLSDGSKYHVAWVLDKEEGRLLTAWTRVPWTEVVFSQKAGRRPHKAS